MQLVDYQYVPRNQYCSSLTSITIPNGVTSIGNYTFSGCSSVWHVPCPEPEEVDDWLSDGFTHERWVTRAILERTFGISQRSAINILKSLVTDGKLTALGTRNHLNPVTIGRALRKLGFGKKSNNGVKGYSLVRLSKEEVIFRQQNDGKPRQEELPF